MKRLTLVMPYYMNYSMLALHYANWVRFPNHVKDRLDVIIVDDGSPEALAADVPRPKGLPRLSIYRIKVDIPWNQHGARNLGAHVAEGPWLLMTDMDHMMLPESVERLLQYDDGSKAYAFTRLDAPNLTPTLDHEGAPKPHVNSFAVTKKAYWRTGGYDEDFCGMYGTDGLFRKRLFHLYQRTVLPEVVLVRYGREHVPDASTSTLERREKDSCRGATRKRREWKKLQGREHVIVTLKFPWEQVL